MCDAYFEFKTIQVDGGAADTVQSAYLFKIYILERFSGIDFVDGARGGFHHTACGAKDNAGACRFAHRVVERTVQY